MDDITSGALTFTTGAAAAADIVACTTGTFDFAAGTADGARACTAVTVGAAVAISACCTIATADGCALRFLLST